MFDHEKLDAYRLSIAFVAWAGDLIDAAPRSGRPNAYRHLDEAGTSVALNIAEGNGKGSILDRVRYFEIARGSALECAACLDVLVARRKVDAASANVGKATLVRVVSTLTRLIERWVRASSTSTSTSTSTS